VAPLHKDRFTLETGIYSTNQQAMVATGTEINVCYDYAKLCKIDMPADFRGALEEIMGSSSQ
jgi:acyl-CoA thioesterase FadM